MQPICLLLIGQRRTRAQKRDRLNLLALQCVAGDRMNHRFLSRRPSQLDGIQIVALAGEAEILCCIVLRLGVLK